MPCPTCDMRHMRQWDYDEHTLTCKNGHRIPKGTKPPRRLPLWSVPAAAAGTLALDLIVRSLT